LDLDDVLCLNNPYGGNDVRQAAANNAPPDLWQRLFHPTARDVLLQVLQEHQPTVVLTTSWLRFMQKQGFEAVFKRTGLELVSAGFHETWEAPQPYGQTRRQAIELWLSKHHAGEPFVVLDDQDSGTGLKGSKLHKAGRVILCEVGIGLQETHLPTIQIALR
jgi:hypothetical protein